jgi:hypothetical protein
MIKGLEGSSDIYVIDIDKNYVDKLSDVMDTSDISGFPTLRYIFNGKTEEFESSSIPKKSRETESFAAWTQSHIGDSSMHYEEESDSKLNNSSRKMSPLTRASNMPPSSKSDSLSSKSRSNSLSSLTSLTMSSLTGPSYMTKRKSNPMAKSERLSSLFPSSLSSLTNSSSGKRRSLNKPSSRKNSSTRSYKKRSSTRSSGRRSSKKYKNITNSNKKGGKWSMKYKKSINCNRPKGFSQKQHCKYGRK